jgi:glycosyltransferase involved in cell wall biosynthesis
MKHVTIDARWVDTSGIGTYLKNILPGIIKQNPDIKFLLLGKLDRLNNLFGHFNNVELKHFLEPMYSISEQLKYPQVIPKNTDLYFATHFNVPIFTKQKLLVTVYDLFHLANPHLVNSYFKSAYARIMFHIIKRRAKNIITISEFSKKEFNRLVGNPKCPINAIPLGIKIDICKEKIPAQSLTKSYTPYILYVGNIKPHKNLNRLIDAFCEIKNSVPHKLLLVGKKDGFRSGDGDVGKIISTHMDRIVLTGFVDDDELDELYHFADIFVFPSL